MENNFNITNLFFDAAKNFPGNIAIIHNNRKISYKELAEQIENTSQYFLSKGIKKGDRVLVFVPMSIDLYRNVLGLFHIGATAVFLDEWVSKKRLEECCKIAQCKAFIGIFKARIFALFSSELHKIPIKLSSGYVLVNKKNQIEKTSTNDTALITFTTGSTGIPKAAKRTHGFLKAQFDALINKINPQASDVDLPVLPIVLLINLGIGCTSVIIDYKASKPNAMNSKKISEQIANNKVNRIVASPFFIKTLSHYIKSTRIKLPTVKKIFTGGAPVFPEEASLYQKSFPSTQIEIVYGSTEAEPISAINAYDLIKQNLKAEKGLCVGIPDIAAKVKIIKITENNINITTEHELDKLEVDKGEIGEIIVSGNHVLREYLNNENALNRNKIFINDVCWHRTGDSGFMTEKNILYLTGRCNSIIHRNGEIISPFLYEGMLQSMEDIAIGTVLDVKNKLYLIVEPKNRKQDNNDILQKLKITDLIFDDIIFLAKIPRDPRHNSKIDYEKLKLILSQYG